MMRRGLFLAVLVALCVTIYRPALSRFFAADHLWYFVEVKDESLIGGLRHYDYAHSRRFMKGDDALFRPFSFGWLAFLNASLGRNPVKWNVAHLCLHLLAVYCLYELLRRSCSWPFPELVAGFFAVAVVHIELVTWNHLGGYIWGFAMLMLALLAARDVVAELPKVSRSSLLKYGAAITCAMGFHEIGVVAAMLVPVFFWWYGRQAREVEASTVRAMVISAVAPVALYAGVYLLRAPGRLFWAAGGPTSIWEAFSLLYFWTERTLFPWAFPFRLAAFDRFWIETDNEMSRVAFAAVLIALATILPRTIWEARSRARLSKEAPFVMLIAVLMCAYAGMVALGRAYASGVTYYAYFFLLSLLLLFCFSFDLDALKGLWRSSVIAVLIFLIVASAISTYSVSLRLRDINAPLVRYHDQFNRWVEAHSTEPDFSFSVQYAPSNLDPVKEVLRGYPDAPVGRLHLHVSEILHFRLVDQQDAKYQLTINEAGIPSIVR
jgi:hypothetical protein